MKNICSYITEKLKLNKDSGGDRIKPKDKEELRKIIIERIIKRKGREKINLNDIDVSAIEDMSDLFNINKTSFKPYHVKGFIMDKWDVSNVKNMSGMFFNCMRFNSDISSWDVSNVKYMNEMFFNCFAFNCNLGKWRPESLEECDKMFYWCGKLKFNIGNWPYTGKVRTHKYFAMKADNITGVPPW